jgi:MoxR-like ATPase
MVMATQNPIEYEGTYPLPEAELDRFTMRIAIGYPPLADEAKMLSVQATDTPLDSLEPVASAQELLEGIEAARQIYVEESLNRYVVSVVRHTRDDARLALGASPRAGISLLRVAKAHAVLRGREYVIPADVKEVAADVLSHRVIMAADARSGGVEPSEVIREAVDRTPVPV